jgi:hypothetical protein
MQLLADPPPVPDPAPPGGEVGGTPFSASGCCCPTMPNTTAAAAVGDDEGPQAHTRGAPGDGAGVGSAQCDYRGIWSYRRAFAGGDGGGGGGGDSGVSSGNSSWFSSRSSSSNNNGVPVNDFSSTPPPPPPPAFSAVDTGDVSQQNWGPSGNDLDNAYLFLPLADARVDVDSGVWAGGVNMTTLAMLEQRAWGWFHAYVAVVSTVS